MNIITVIPLSRSKIAEELIYFTSSETTVGDIVTVPLRKKNISAIITKIEPAENLKGDLKKASFEIKKIDKVKSTKFFTSSFIQSCKAVANYYSTNTGSVIDAIVSNQILENIGKIKAPADQKASDDNRVRSRTFAIQGDDTDRISAWRSLIRQEFANKKSVAIYVPTIEDCNQFFLSLEKGIDGYIFILNSSLSPKKILSTWKTIAETDHPIVIIATGSFSILPRSDIRTTIIERENGRGWIQQKTPYLDIRHALIETAKANQQSIYLADSLLRLETLHNVENETYEEGSPFKWRSVSLAEDLLVDMKKEKSDRNSEDEKDIEQNNVKKNEKLAEGAPSRFRILSNELKALIARNHVENTHLFIFALRRGHSPITACDDCGNIVTCRNCSRTVVLHTSPDSGKNYFMCHLCGERRSADENCIVCDSWRLTPLGIGIDRVKDEIEKDFPDIELIKIDADATKTDKEVNQKIERFKSRPGSILLGTELALQYLNEKIDHVAIVSLDSLFSLPDFRIQEKVMYNIVRLRAQATRSILVQTRKIDQKVFEYGLKGNLSDFYRTTVDERKAFNYPPFTILIKITIEGKKEEIAKTMAEVAKFLEPQELDIFPAFTATVRGKSVIHGLIKVPSHAWPDIDLVSKLRSLPPNVMVKINPESLL
jgi:primosomal protein N' (replication factor Y)